MTDSSPSLPMPPRRVRFGLRTLFVVVTVICIWLGYSLNWIRQRREFLEGFEISGTHLDFIGVAPLYAVRDGHAPLLLRLLGEDGYSYLSIPRATEARREQGRRLFPEAQIED